jgi:hypothetical protein
LSAYNFIKVIVVNEDIKRQRASGPDFREVIKRTLAKRAGETCSNPNCRKPTSGPHSDESKAINLGEAAHIKAARLDQARYDANMTDKERAAISNGIWLCKECARRIDLDETRYPDTLLAGWKNVHEKWVSDGKPEIEETAVPLVDIELTRVKASPEVGQFKIQFAYDIVLHNKSSVAISNVHVVRIIIPDKNRQKIAVHQSAHQKLKPFQKSINVLGPAESGKIYREHSSSYEFMRFNVTYKDQYDKLFRCTFDGDRDGLRLTNKETLGQTKIG